MKIPEYIGEPNDYFCVGPGWHPLLMKLHHQLMAIDPGYNVGQIKEKFGGLRAYMDWTPTNDDGSPAKKATWLDSAGNECSRFLVPAYVAIAQNACARAEEESYRICEECGDPGQHRSEHANGSGAWERTLCDLCAMGMDYFVEEVYITGTGTVLGNVHSLEECEGRHCVIHNPSDHSMRDFPTHWRWDRKIMERICKHGVGHPDPDDLEYQYLRIERENPGAPAFFLEDEKRVAGIHGCDGCCHDPGGTS